MKGLKNRKDILDKAIRTAGYVVLENVQPLSVETIGLNSTEGIFKPVTIAVNVNKPITLPEITLSVSKKPISLNAHDSISDLKLITHIIVDHIIDVIAMHPDRLMDDGDHFTLTDYEIYNAVDDIVPSITKINSRVTIDSVNKLNQNVNIILSYKN